MVFKDYYKILGLETNRVSSEEIKNAYRIMAKKYHPDINIKEPLAEERFKDVNEAYQVLTNNAAKRKYDRIWLSNRLKRNNFSRIKRKSTDSLFSEFFAVFFGEGDKGILKNKKIPEKGEDIETEISITLEEAYFGVEKKVSLRSLNSKDKSFSVKIPAGIKNGEKIKLAGQGKAGRNGGDNGDLIIKIKLEKNDKYTLEGIDLHVDLYLTVWEAALGTKINLPCIDGETTVYVAPRINSGEKIRVPKKGYKTGFGDRGDLIAEVKIVMPKEFTKEEEELFKKMQEISKFNPRD